jgi:uncharacterized protein
VLEHGQDAPAPAEQEPPLLPAPVASGPAAWPWWTAFAALFGGLVLATIGGLLVDIPALALGAKISSSHVSPGLTIADTAVQDAGFIAVAVFFAQLGGRRVDASMFGLRPTRFWRALGLLAVLIVVYLIFSVIWAAVFNTSKEKLLEQLGANETTALLVLSAGLTCVIAPFAEEFLFRGYIFTALRNWRGTLPAAIGTGLLFGGVHVGSAPAIDLLPLAALGFGLCLLYRATGSLYPCIAAHCVNNCIAFANLESWPVWKWAILQAAALGVLWLIAQTLRLTGVTSGQRAPAT